MFGMRYGFYTLNDPQATWDADFCIQKINDIWNYETNDANGISAQFPPSSKNDVKKSAEVLKKVCKIFNDKLASHGKPFLGGDKPHIGDFYVFGFLNSRCINAKYNPADLKIDITKAIFAEHPLLEKYCTITFPKVPQLKELV